MTENVVVAPPGFDTSFAGWLVMALTVNANVDAALDPQLLLAVTDNVPLVAVSEKLIVAVAVVPLVIVAPVPE